MTFELDPSILDHEKHWEPITNNTVLELGDWVMNVQPGMEEIYRLVIWLEANKKFGLAKDGKRDPVYFMMNRASMVRDGYHKAKDRSKWKGLKAPVFVQPPPPAKPVEVRVGYRPTS